jgi:catechol 2,3-dioxygenase-like lactoylglutathione lyase family enzyme
MKFGYCILYVPDVPAALAFYERAFGFSRKFLHESNSYGELATGTTRLAFAAESLAATHGEFRRTRLGESPPAVEIALVTDDVAAEALGPNGSLCSGSERFFDRAVHARRLIKVRS